MMITDCDVPFKSSFTPFCITSSDSSSVNINPDDGSRFQNVNSMSDTVVVELFRQHLPTHNGHSRKHLANGAVVYDDCLEYKLRRISAGQSTASTCRWANTWVTESQQQPQNGLLVGWDFNNALMLRLHCNNATRNKVWCASLIVHRTTREL